MANGIGQRGKILRDPYVYEIDFAGLAVGVAQTVNLNIQADSDFEVQKLTQMTDIAGALQTDATRVIPLATVLLLDTGSGRQLMNAAMPIGNMFGSGEIPFILQQPKIFAARSTIQVTVTSYAVAGTIYNTRLSFIGTKLFAVTA